MPRPPDALRSLRSHPTALLAFLAVLGLQAACGGAASQPTTEKPAGLAYTAPSRTLTVGTAITPDAPSSTGGAITAYAVSPVLPAGLSLDPTSGIFTGTPTAVTAAATYTVTGSNSAGSTTAALAITVNDRPPAELAYANSPATLTLGTTALLVPSSTGGAVVSYAISPELPAGLALDPATGVISGAPTALLDTGTYTVSATNSGGSTTATVAISIIDMAPSDLAYASALVCTRDSACALSAPSNLGGTVVSYAVSPELPAGLAIDASTGAISGTASALSPESAYTVTATNSGGSTTTALSVAVVDVPPAELAYAGALTCTQGLACALAAPTQSGGAVISFAVSPELPAGLAIDASTGELSGTPSALSAESTYTVTATNSGGSTTATVSIAVVDVAPAELAYAGALGCTRGVACALAAPTHSGGAIVSFAVSPELPAGLAIDASTGEISGTPSALSAEGPYTVTATNSGGSTTATVSIAVVDLAPAELAYSNALVCDRDVACALAAPTHSGGAVVSFAISPALPSGLAIDPGTGAISGTPVVASATRSYTVTASNSGGSTTATLNVTVVAPAPVVSAARAVDAPLYVPLTNATYPVSATDGTNQLYVWTDARTGDATRMFAARFGPDGTVLDPAGVLLGGVINGSINASVASSGSLYLVCIRTITNTSPQAFSLDCNTLSSDLSVKGPTIPITSTNATNVSISGFAVVWNPDQQQFFVSWVTKDYNARSAPFFGKRIDANGVAIDAAPVVVRPAGSGSFDYDRSFVALGYGGGHYLITSSEGGTGCGGYHLAATRVKASDLSGGNDYAQLNPGCTNQGQGGIAYDSAGGQFLVLVGESPSSSISAVYVQPVSNVAGATTGTLGTRVQVGTPVANVYPRQASIEVNGTKKIVAVTYNVAPNVVFGLDANNSVESTLSLPVSTTPAGVTYQTKGITAQRSGTGWVVAYSDNRAGDGLHAVRLTGSPLTTSDGTGLDAATGANLENFPCAASAGPGKGWLVAWRDQRSLMQIYARRLADDGTPLDASAVRLGAASATAQGCAVAYSSGTYLVSWADGASANLVAARVDGATGAVKDATPIVLGGTQAMRPSSAGGANGFLVMWNTSATVSCGANSSCSKAVLGAHVGVDGTVAEPGGFVVSDATNLGTVQGAEHAVFFDGTGFQAAYAFTTSSSTGLLFTRPVPATGLPNAATVQVGSAASTKFSGPSIAARTGGGSLVAWTEFTTNTSSDVKARAVVSGVAQGSAATTLASGSGATAHGSAQLVSDGITTWLALVTGPIAYNQWGILSSTGPAAISLRTIDGALATGAPLVLEATTGLSFPQLSLAGNGGGTVLGAYSSVIENSQRVSVRLIK